MSFNYTACFTEMGNAYAMIADNGTYNGSPQLGYTGSGTIAQHIGFVDTNFSALTEPTNKQTFLNTLNNMINSGDVANLNTTCQGVAQNSLLYYVNLFKGAGANANNDINSALAFLQAQMNTDSQSFDQNTVSQTITNGGSNIGDGVLVSSLKRSDGVALNNPFAESILFTCTSDSYSGGATAGLEPFGYAGQTRVNNTLNPAYPGYSGSGAQGSVTSFDPFNNSSNLLYNGNMQTFTVSNVPDGWVYVTGTAGTQAVQDNTTQYEGTGSLKIIGNTGTALVLKQLFAQSSVSAGSTNSLSALAPLAFGVRLKASGAITTGTITFELYNETGSTILQDAQGNNLSFTTNLSALTTSWVSYNTTFFVGRSLPASYSIRISVTSNMSAGDVWLQDICVVPMTQVYTNGPYAAVLSGAIPAAKNDTHNIAVANNFNSLWTVAMEVMFGLNALGLILPQSGSPTISKNLIDDFMVG